MAAQNAASGWQTNCHLAEQAFARRDRRQIHSLGRIDDIEHYHSLLQQVILERESDPQYGLTLFRGACGIKVHHVDRWKSPAANLIHQRTMALFCAIRGVAEPVCDISWGSIYRKGDYCMPHSHLRTEASVIYQLSMGDVDENDPMGGRLGFTDPRIDSCCLEEPGRATTPLLPEMVPGMMLIFPAK